MEDERFKKQSHDFPKWAILCMGCGVRTPIAEMAYVVKIWNRRSTVQTAGRHTTDSIPVEWIRQQAEEFPGMESAMWNKLLRLWEKKNDYEDLYES